jgi:hypothetical protein
MSPWKPIPYAPINRDVEVWVTDGVEEFLLGFPCRRTESGWVHSRLATPVPERLKLIFWRDLKD